MSFYLKKNNIKTEWLLQQNHTVGGMIEAPNETLYIKDVVKNLVKKVF